MLLWHCLSITKIRKTGKRQLATANRVITLFLQPFAHECIHLVCMCFEALEQFELSLRADQVVLRTVYLVVCVTVDVIG